MLRAFTMAAIAALVFANQSELRAQSAPLAIDVDRIVTSNGVIENGRVLVLAGRIAAVGNRATVLVPAGARRISQAGGVLTPGLIDAASHLGADDHLNDVTVVSLPDVALSDIAAAQAKEWNELATLGITTVHVIPGAKNVVGGRTGVGRRGEHAQFDWLRPEVALHASLDKAEWPTDQPPTSLIGAIDHLHGLLPRPSLAALRKAPGGLVVRAPGPREVDAAARFAKAWGQPVSIIINSTGYARAAERAKAFHGVILEPLGTDLVAHQARDLRALFKAGVPVGFGSRTPLSSPSGLRLSAIGARVAGVDKARIGQALTSDAARILGIEDQVGSIRNGLRADLVIWSHDPTDARARVLAVFQDGRLVGGPLNEESRR